jgi:hypothetical protein
MSSPAAQRRVREQAKLQEQQDYQQKQAEEFNINDRRLSEQEKDEQYNLDPILQNDQQLRNELNIARSPGHNEMNEKDFDEYTRRREDHNMKRINNDENDRSVKKNIRDRVVSILNSSLEEYESQIMSLYSGYKSSISNTTMDNILLESNRITVDFVYAYLSRNDISVDASDAGSVKELVDNIFFSTLTTILEGYRQQNVDRRMILESLTDMFNESTFKINKTELNRLVDSNISIGQSFKRADSNMGKKLRWQGGKSRRRKHKRKLSKKNKRKNTKKNNNVKR